MVTKIRAYSNKSKSAILLSEALDVWMLNHTGSSYVPQEGDTVINWGNGANYSPARTLNEPENVRLAVNKRRAFNKFHEAGVSIPAFTQYASKAQKWLDEGHTLIARAVLDGHEGQGIILVKPGSSLPEAGLYVKYIDKDSEYRIHVMNGKAFDCLRKVHKDDPYKVDTVCNTEAGYVYSRKYHIPQAVESEAIKAIAALGLDFGAVDVVYTNGNAMNVGSAYVLEVNTAPGIEGLEVTKYVKAFKENYKL